MPATQGKHWVFTLNHYTDSEYNRLTNEGQTLSHPLVYLIIGKETGAAGTPHLQGFLQWATRKTFNYTKSFISERAHIERAKGTPDEASTYCKKDGDFQEFGILQGGQGRRSDLSAVADLIQEGKSFKEIAEAQPAAAIRYGTGILRLRQLYRPTRSTAPEIWTFWGETGTGKTRRVYEFADLEQLWIHPGDRWFDGYDGQHAVLFDDFDGGWFKLTYLLKLLDRYVFQVPIKGGYTWWAPKTIYITTNLEPKLWYPNAHRQHQDALIRRLEEFGTIQQCIQYN